MIPITNPPVKAVLFDLFNTLTSVFLVPDTQKHAWEMLGLDRTAWEQALFDTPDKRLKGFITRPEDVIRDVTDKISPDLPDDLIATVAAARMARFAAVLHAVPDHTLSVLEELKNRGFLLALVSNADVTEKTGWADTPAADLFDACVFSCDVGYMKPEPEIYDLALRALEVKAEECLFVGDGGSDEFTGAKACGITTACTTEFIRTRWPERVTACCTDADFCLYSLTGLL